MLVRRKLNRNLKIMKAWAISKVSRRFKTAMIGSLTLAKGRDSRILCDRAQPLAVIRMLAVEATTRVTTSRHSMVKTLPPRQIFTALMTWAPTLDRCSTSSCRVRRAPIARVSQHLRVCSRLCPRVMARRSPLRDSRRRISGIPRHTAP